MSAKRPPNSTTVTPSGIEIEFYDSTGVDGEKQQRRYLCNGERYVNVTTVLGVLDKSDALIPWALGLHEQGLDWREVRNEAGNRGTSTHDVVIRALLRERVSLDDLEAEHRPYGQAGYRWKRARDPKVLGAELLVAAPSHQLAGRLDLLCEIEGALVLADLKTLTKWARTKKGELYPPYPENLLQLDLYTQCLIESGYEAPERGLIVRLGPDGEYDETWVDPLPERGLRVLDAYRARAAANTALRDARREAVAHA